MPCNNWQNYKEYFDKHRVKFVRLKPHIQRDVNDTGCWRYDGYHCKKGRPYIGRSIFGKPRLLSVYTVTYLLKHRDLWACFDNMPFEVLHHMCFNKWCVNPDHLQPMSFKDHAILHQRMLGRQGQSQHYDSRGRPCRFNVDEFIFIHDLKKEGWSAYRIAEFLNVHRQRVYDALDRKGKYGKPPYSP